MAFSDSIKAIMERISKKPPADEVSQAETPSLSPDRIFAAIAARVDETVMPRTLMAELPNAAVLLHVANQQLMNVVPAEKPEALDKKYRPLTENSAAKKAAEFAITLLEFASEGGSLKLHPETSAATFEAEENSGVTVDMLIAAKAPPSVEEKPAKAKPKAAAQKSAAKKVAKAKPTEADKATRSAKSQPSDLLLDAYIEIEKFADVVILLSNAGTQIEISDTEKSSPLTGNQKALADDVSTWHQATAPVIGRNNLVVLRAEGLDGNCVCLLPDDAFLMVAFVPNRHLARIFSAAHMIKAKGSAT